MEDSVRVDVENRICDEQGPRADSYLRPQLVAFHTMNEVSAISMQGIVVVTPLRFLRETLYTLRLTLACICAPMSCKHPCI